MNNSCFKIALSLALITFCSLELFAQCDSVNTVINDKIRVLGSWNSNGTPDYLESEKDTVSEEIENFINTVLPESASITDSGYFSEDAKPNTELLDSANIYLTFVHEGAKWKNTLGFYTYDLSNPPTTYEEIDSLVIVFPNVDSVNVINAGDKVHLGLFPPNIGIGYFLITQGWTGDTVCLKDRIVFTDKDLNTFTSAQHRQHTIMLNYEAEQKFLLGIEDQPRPSGDKDFNDAVFYISADKYEAIDSTEVPKIPVAEIFGDTVLCSDEDLATVTIELSGTPPFTFTYNNGTDDIEVSEISDYTYSFQTSIKDTLTLVSLYDADGMGIVKGNAILQTSPLHADFVSNPISLCDGSPVVEAEVYLKGFPPYTLTYEEDGVEIVLDNILEDTISITANVGKEYILTMVEDQYCSKILDSKLAIEEFDKPTASLESVDSTLCEGNTLEVNISFTGEEPFTFIYEVNTIKDTILVNQSSYTLEVNESSEITPISVSDTHCTGGTVSGAASVVILDAPEVEITTPDTDCGSTETKEITLEFSGTGPFNYEYDLSGTVVTGSTEDTLAVGLETGESFELLSFSDSSCDGIVDTDKSSFTYYEEPSANLVTQNTFFCEGEEADLLVHLSGTGPYTFVISNGTKKDTINTSDNEHTFTTNIAGIYSLLSVSNENCDGTVSGQAVVEAKSSPDYTVDATSNKYCGQGEAEIIIEFTGTAPFNFDVKLGDELTSYSSNEDSYALYFDKAGTYEVLNVSDSYCQTTKSETFEIIHLEEPKISLTAPDFICENEPAFLEVNLSGVAPFTFKVLHGTEEQSITTSENTYSIEIHEAGTYEVIEFNDASCSINTEGIFITIEESASPEAVVTHDDVICEEEVATVSFSFTGESPWTFTLTKDGFEETYTSTESEYEVALSEGGMYEIVNFSDAKCSGTIADKIEIVENAKPTAEIRGGGDLCGEDETATIVIELTGRSPFTFVYTDGSEETEITTDDDTYSFETSEAGNYELVSQNDQFCSGIVSGLASVTKSIDNINGEILGEDAVCGGEEFTLTLSLTEPIDSDFTWTTTGLGTLTSTGPNEISYTPASGESGDIDFTATVENECGEKTFTKTIKIIPIPVSDFTVSPEELFAGQDILFVASGDIGANYTWTLGDGTTLSGEEIIHLYENAGLYDVTLTSEIEGCESDTFKTITVKSLNELYVPNVFNPNALHPENQVVKVYGSNVSEDNFSFKIVNRWGNLMYQTDSFFEANSQGWDGREFNNEEMQSLSTFSYILVGKFKDGETFERTGTITILQ